MLKEVSLIGYDKEIEATCKYEHYSVDFHNTFGHIRSLHVRLTPLCVHHLQKLKRYQFRAKQVLFIYW